MQQPARSCRLAGAQEQGRSVFVISVRVAKSAAVRHHLVLPVLEGALPPLARRAGKY